ncbi:YhjD/YihY/BrkB family envelope integrity protein [Jatrophihabitans sp.]|uniref:YhjD/YihY/BrkB family envelope integrity protein n=1 Tax=Jatrophihabitans sp. TaxID=1932789 RepID=UPI0030C7787A|nr:Membrane protein [Jatrophihabitans sp.]
MAAEAAQRPPNALTRIKAAAAARWQALRARRPSVRHGADAWKLLGQNNGNQYAAAITYFSFLALFPLLLLAVGVTGFVLHAHPAAQASLFDHITKSVPGSFGTQLHKSINTAIKSRAGVGIIGLVGVLLAGLSWVGNLRNAIDGVWGRSPAKRNFAKARLSSLLILAGLGLGILVSVGLTVLGTALTDQILSGLGLDHLPGAGVLVRILGLLLAVVGDVVIFFWMLVRLPQEEVDARIGLKAALLAAVGFEILKVAATYTIAASAGSPTAGPFASLLAVLIWIQLVSRFLLYCVALTSVLKADVPAAAPVPAAVVTPRPLVAPDDEPPLSPAAVGVGLVGAGAVAGAAAGWYVGRRRLPE